MKTSAPKSVFDDKTIEELYAEVQEVYRNYPYPWVVGYSGGKDSTATLQMIWNALARMDKKELTKPVYVISSDTLVETPMIVNYIDSALEMMNNEAKRQGLPITAHKLSPELGDTFWVNLIGKGYPAPNNAFRWCTDRLKIKPSNKFILSKVAEHGEVILALGMRRGESNKRDQVIANHEFKGHRLAHHGQLKGSWVFMPIEHFTKDDVWTYLLKSPTSPWGSNNRSLAALYNSAQSGECPLVVDDTTSSCGNSRFGCWTCTVVAKDKSMEAMIDSGEDWMIPLLNYRDWLSTTQNPEVKHEQREVKGRDGRVKLVNGEIRYRTYKLEFSQQMLKRLLQTQVQVQKFDPDYELIGLSELLEIRKIWITERHDWADTVPKIYQEVLGRKMPTEFSDVFTPGVVEQEVLREIAQKHEVPMQLIQKLLDAEWQNYGMFRRAGIHNVIEKIYEEDWNQLEEIMARKKEEQSA